MRTRQTNRDADSYRDKVVIVLPSVMPERSGKQSTRFAASLVLAVLSLCGSGCMGHLGMGDTSTIVRFPRTRNEVEYLVVHENLHVGGDDQRSLEHAKEELAGFANQLGFRQDRFLRCLIEPLFLLPRYRQSTLYMSLVSIQMNGGHMTFFLDAEGRVCGRDRWNIANRANFVASINRMVCREIEATVAEILPEGKHMIDNNTWFDQETLRRCQRASRTGYTWFRCEPGIMECRFPASPDAFRKLQQDWKDTMASLETRYRIEFDGTEVKFTAKDADERTMRLVHRSLETPPPSPLDEGLLGIALAMNGYWLPQRDTGEVLNDFVADQSRFPTWLLDGCLGPAAMVILGTILIFRRRSDKKHNNHPDYSTPSLSREKALTWTVTMIILIALPWPLMVLALPLFSFEMTAHAYSCWTMWLWTGLLGLVLAILLTSPVLVENEFILSNRGRICRALAAGFLLAVLVFGASTSLCEVGWGPRRTLHLVPLFLALAGVVWLGRVRFLLRHTRNPNSSAVPWPCGGLLLWSCLELLVVLGAHMAARLATWHGGGAFTTIGLAIGMSVMIIVLATAVFFWCAARWGKVRSLVVPEGLSRATFPGEPGA
jgi:hypothetical protein